MKSIILAVEVLPITAAGGVTDDKACTPFFIARILALQAEYDAGLEYIAHHGYTDGSIHLDGLIIRALENTRELTNSTLQAIRDDGALLFAWEGTQALRDQEGSAA